MIDRPDLDPKDTSNRVAIREQLKAIRRDQRISARALCAQAGWNRWNVDHMEAASNWGVGRIQSWARALDHRFVMTIQDLTVPDDDDFEAALLRVTTPFGALDEDNLHVQAIVVDLARIRCGQGLGYAQFGAAIGAGDRSVRGWEENPTRCLVKTVQRYARGLGGHLALEVVPVNVAVLA